MASARSRPKNKVGSDATYEVARLLQSRAGLHPVTPALTSAAERLRDRSLITFEVRRYVQCALSEDWDFQHSNRTCSGRLFLSDGLDENGRDYQCGECGRTVFPHRHRKRQFEELSATVLPDGVAEYVLACAGEPRPETLDGVSWAWRISRGVSGVYLCLADYCDHERVMSVQWAQQNPTCFVAVNPRAVERFVKIDWVSKVMLADLLTDRVSLRDVLSKLTSSDEVRALPPLVTAAYNKGPHRPQVLSKREPRSAETFVLQFGPKTVQVNGVEVIAAQGKTILTILRLLAKAFWEDAIRGVAPDGFLCQTPDDLASQLDKRDTAAEPADVDLIRRTINRFQDSAMDRLRKAGVAAERNDIIQTSPDPDSEGYRLNPFTVCIRPLDPLQNPK